MEWHPTRAAANMLEAAARLPAPKQVGVVQRARAGTAASPIDVWMLEAGLPAAGCGL